jgi:electron transfer flavoprotein alpha subunit
MSTLIVLAETDGQNILPGTLPTITFAQLWAQQTGGVFDLLVVGGAQVAGSVNSLRHYGARRILLALSPALEHPTADRVAALFQGGRLCQMEEDPSVAALSSTFGRDVLPRIAAVLDVPMLSDVLSVERVEGRLTFRRPMYAGNILATVQIEGDRGVFSVRGTAFGKPEEAAWGSVVERLEIDPGALPQGTTWLRLSAGEQKRPELTNARVVVSGGRPLRDAETFERLIGGLADKLGGATGATRAAVDSGIAPNEMQVGQTGKVVAPELYIAAGISGSVQHLAGMKDSKVIVAINIDPDAPIFEVADYGLVMDLHQAIPELLEKL